MTNKKVLWWALCIPLIIAVAWMLSPRAYALSGSGTSADPYRIASISDLAGMHSDLDGYYVLEQDIDLLGGTFTPVGNENEGAFTGTLDGQGHMISNLMIREPESKYAGLFGYLEGTVRNVKLDRITMSGGRYAGGIAGCAGYGSEITDCAVLSGAVSANSTVISVYAGGITGLCEGSLTRCQNGAEVTAESSVYIPLAAGGIIGYMDGPLEAENCLNNGVITVQSTASGGTVVSQYVGGILGYAAGDLTLADCRNDGIISSHDYGYVAGVVSNTSGGNLTLKNCSNSAVISGNYAAGILGSHSGTSTIRDCINSGDISGRRFSGGIVSQIGGSFFISDCENNGRVNGSCCGGVAAVTIIPSTKGSIENCQNENDVIGYTQSGGIVGLFNNSGTHTVSRCINKGIVITEHSSGYAGGICGENNSKVTISYCTNWGSISSSSARYVGSIAGYGGMTDHCVNLGTASGRPYNSSRDIVSIGKLAEYEYGVFGLSPEKCLYLQGKTSVYCSDLKYSAGSVGKTMSELQDEVTYQEQDWTMADWTFDPARNSGLPMPVGYDLDYMDQSLLILKVGETDTLTPPFTADVWASEDSNIASCENGMVTANKIGATVISAYEGNERKANCVVFVYQPVDQVSLSQASAALTKGTSITLTTDLPANDPQGIIWSSSNANVASVGQAGVVTGNSAGTAVITARLPLSGVSASCEVTVTAPVTAISLPSNPSVSRGVPTELSYTITPAGYTGTVSWSSSDETILTVENGVVTGHQLGSAVVTAKADSGVSATCTVTVKQPAESLTLDRTEITLELGYTDRLVATLLPEDSTDTLTWKSGNTSIVTVSNGILTPKAVGKTTVSVTSTSGLTAHCVVTVKAATVLPQSVTLSQTLLRPTVGEKVQLQATVLPTTATDRTVRWESSDPAVASVNTTGVVEALAPGTAEITATSVNGMYDICAVKVSQASSAGFVVSSERVKSGKTVETTISAVKNPGIAAFTLEVSYDTELLTPVKISTGELLEGGQLTSDLGSGEPGILRVTWYCGENASGDGEAFRILWKASSIMTGTAQVSLQYSTGDICNDEQETVAFTAESGIVRVLDYQIGDIYMDDAVNMKDIVYFARYFNGQERMEELQRLAADLYEDAVLDARDLSMLAKVLVTSLEEETSVTLLKDEETSPAYEISISSAVPDSSGRVQLTVSGKNCPGISAFRFQIVLPEGYEVQEILPGELLSEGAFGYDPQTRIVTYYQTERADLDGILFTMDIQGQENAKYGAVSLKYLPEDFFMPETYQEIPVVVHVGGIDEPAFANIQGVAIKDSGVSVTLETNMEQAGKFIVAFYKDGQMCHVASKQISVSSGTFTVETKLPAVWDNCKVFLLDENAIPLCPCFCVDDKAQLLTLP